MATLTGTTIQSTYDSLLKVSDNDAITSTLKRITDGLGNNTPLYLSSSAVEISSGLNVVGSLTASNLSGTNTGDETKSSIETKLGAATASNSGFLTSTDWSTFNNKVAGSGTLNTLAKFTSSSSIGDSLFFDNGTNAGVGTVTPGAKLDLFNATGETALQISSGADFTRLFFRESDDNFGVFINNSTRLRFIGSSGNAAILESTSGNFAVGTVAANATTKLFVQGTGFFNDSVGIGSTGLSASALRVAKPITGATTAFGIYIDSAVQSDVTSVADGFRSAISSVSGTLTDLAHYRATGASLTSVTNQYGFTIGGNLINATNNYGFHSTLAAGTGRWNLFMQGTANNHLAGALGIGTTSLTGVNLSVNRNLTGATVSNSVLSSVIVQSDVTTSGRSFQSNIGTAAASFTLTNIVHYGAAQGVFGAGSTVTNQFGYFAGTTLTGATNNYSFYGDMASGTGRWNLYMNGNARNFLQGSLTIGSTVDVLSSTSVSPLLKVVDASSNSGAIFQNIENNTNTNNIYFTKTRSGIAGNYTVGVQANDNLMFLAGEGSDGVSALRRSATIIMSADGNFSATSAPGRITFGTTPSGSVAVSERMRIDSAGGVGIGATALTGYSLRIQRNITGASPISFGVMQQGQVQSDVTFAYGFNNESAISATVAATDYVHYRTAQGTWTAGGTVTNQYGFVAGASLISATNNFGFRGAIPSGTNRWNLFMDGTANNHMAGGLGIGATFLTAHNLRVDRNITGGITAHGIYNGGIVQSDVTTQARYYTSAASTQATTFTCSDLRHYLATQGTFGAGSTVAVQHGFIVDSTLIGGTTNYGFRGQIPSGTGRWNIFMDGTARNFLQGALNIGSTTDNGTGAVLQVTGGITYQNIFNRRSNNYTLVLTDQNDIVEMNIDVTANTVTVPTNASVAFPIGTEILIMRYGSGITEIVPSSGVTIRSKASFRKIADQYTGATLVKVGTDEWYLVGNLTA